MDNGEPIFPRPEGPDIGRLPTIVRPRAPVDDGGRLKIPLGADGFAVQTTTTIDATTGQVSDTVTNAITIIDGAPFDPVSAVVAQRALVPWGPMFTSSQQTIVNQQVYVASFILARTIRVAKVGMIVTGVPVGGVARLDIGFYNRAKTTKLGSTGRTAIAATPRIYREISLAAAITLQANTQYFAAVLNDIGTDTGNLTMAVAGGFGTDWGIPFAPTFSVSDKFNYGNFIGVTHTPGNTVLPASLATNLTDANATFVPWLFLIPA